MFFGLCVLVARVVGINIRMHDNKFTTQNAKISSYTMLKVLET